MNSTAVIAEAHIFEATQTNMSNTSTLDTAAISLPANKSISTTHQKSVAEMFMMASFPGSISTSITTGEFSDLLHVITRISVMLIIDPWYY